MNIAFPTAHTKTLFKIPASVLQYTSKCLKNEFRLQGSSTRIIEVMI